MYSRILKKLIPSAIGMLKRNPISYSIWLMPAGNIKDQLKNTIYSLSTDFGGPIFEPHITLVSSFVGNEEDLIQKTEIISKKIKPFKIFFDRIAYLDNFFCSLFLMVKVNIELELARNIACDELNWNDNHYMPHLSLIYGNYSKKEKEKMISTVDNIPDWFLVDYIYFASNDEINLEWKVIQAFDLNN